MNFSYQFESAMRSMAERSNMQNFGGCEIEFSTVWLVTTKVDLKASEVCEVPSFMENVIHGFADQVWERRTNDSPFTDTQLKAVMHITDNNITCAGAESAIKFFNRAYNGRLWKVTTNKGEVYYGRRGLIMDDNFTPLLLSTENLIWDKELLTTRPALDYNIYLHPEVFIDDSKSLNKVLAKKGIAFYLSNHVNTWRQMGTFNIKVEDISERFFEFPVKPTVNHCSAEDFGKVLKDNKEELINQIKYDLN